MKKTISLILGATALGLGLVVSSNQTDGVVIEKQVNNNACRYEVTFRTITGYDVDTYIEKSETCRFKVGDDVTVQYKIMPSTTAGSTRINALIESGEY